MPHIHTEPGQHDHTASAFIIRMDSGVPKLLLHKHKKLGTLTQVGGHIELDETPWQAVLHELREESGYDPQQLQVLQPKQRIRALSGVDLHHTPLVTLTHQFSDDHFHSDLAWAFITDELPHHKVSDSQSTDIRFLTRQQIAEDTSLIPEDIREIAFYIFDNLAKWERVVIS